MPGIRPTNTPDHPFRRLVVLVVISFALTMVDARGSIGALKSLRDGVGAAISPLQSGAFSVSQPIAGFFSDWSEVGSKNDQIQRLQADNDRLQRLVAADADAYRRASELDSMLQLAGLAKFKIIPAAVMSIGAAAGYGSTLLIDAGSEDGVKKDMNVISGSGLVGRVTRAFAHTAEVVLLVDATSSVGARIEKSGEVGFISGTGSANYLSLEFIDPTARALVGDRVVSYGVNGGVFLPGVPIGVVTQVKAQVGTNSAVATVTPFVNMTALDLVGVIVTAPRTDPRDALLPTPTVVPTVTVTQTVIAGVSPTALATISASSRP